MPGKRRQIGQLATLAASAVAAATLGGASAVAVGGGAVPSDGSYGFVAKVDFGGVRACSGALVDPSWVLTAKSCFSEDGQPVVAGAPARVTTATIGRTDLTANSGHAVAVTALVPHPDRDVVLIELASPVTDVTIPSLGAAPTANEVLHVAGYGRTATEWVPNQLHAATFTVGGVSAATFDVTGTDANATICRGDAGGPAVREVGDRVELVGLNHTSWQRGCLGESETRTGAVETRVNDLGSWIQQSLVTQPAGLAWPVTGEFNRDAYADLLGVDPATGALWLYPGTATPGTWGRRIVVETGGWETRRDLVVGRYNRDGYDDLLAVEPASGKLWLYPGTAAGITWGTRAQAGTGWSGMSRLAGGQFNRDGFDDLIAVQTATGRLYMYSGTTAGTTFTAGVSVGNSGWTAMSKLISGRFNRDAYDDIIAVESATGKLLLYPGVAAGNTDWTNPVTAGNSGWNAMGGLAVGQFNGDAYDDLAAFETLNEQMWIYPGTAAGVTWGSRYMPNGRVSATPPGGLTSLLTGEFTRDAHPDLIGVEPLSGRLWLYPGTADLTWAHRILIGGSGWQTMSKTVIGRFNGDQYDDLIGVETSTGKLWLYPGTTAGGALGTRVQAGTSGWNAMNDLVAGKFDRDDVDDLLTVEASTGKLWLYPGSASKNGTDWGGRVAADNAGWTAMNNLTAGRFNRDDHDDLLAVETSTGKLYLYPGTAAGTTWGSRVEVPIGSWANRRDLVAEHVDSDDYDDLLAVDTQTGKLLYYPGTVSGGTSWGQPVEVG